MRLTFTSDLVFKLFVLFNLLFGHFLTKSEALSLKITGSVYLGNT